MFPHLNHILSVWTCLSHNIVIIKKIINTYHEKGLVHA